MREYVVFLHIISAMVLFGLPLAFGRFLGVTIKLGVRDAIAARDALRLLTRRYLYLSWLLNLATGLYLLHRVAAVYSLVWQGLIVTLSLLIGANLFFGLDRGVSHMLANDESSFAALRRRVTIFSIVHHSLVTTLTALMVFRVHFV